MICILSTNVLKGVSKLGGCKKVCGSCYVELGDGDWVIRPPRIEHEIFQTLFTSLTEHHHITVSLKQYPETTLKSQTRAMQYH